MPQEKTRKILKFLVFPQSLQKHAILHTKYKNVVHPSLGYCLHSRQNTFNKVFNVTVVFLAVAFAQNAKEVVIRRKLFVIQFLFTVETFKRENLFAWLFLWALRKESRLVAPSNVN